MSSTGFVESRNGIGWVRGGVILIALCTFVYLGNIKNFNGFIWDYDTRSWYTAGVCWWSGDSPYDREQFTDTWIALYEQPPRNNATFVYPPTMAVVSLPLALFPWPVAAWLFRVCSLLSVVGICFFTHRLAGLDKLERPPFSETCWYWAVCALLASVTQCVTQGQCATVVVCGCLAAWYGWRKEHWPIFLAGFLLAAIKPQISLLPLLFILSRGGVRWFVGGSALTLGFCALILVVFPNTAIFEGYEGSLENHLSYQIFNQWNRYCGVPALLGGFSWGKEAAVIGVSLGCLAVGWLGLRAKRRYGDGAVSLREGQFVWVIAFAAMPIHIYDLTGQVFVVATAWSIRDWRIRVVAIVTMIAANRVPTVALVFHKIGGWAEPINIFLLQAGTPLCAASLLGLFIWRHRQEAAQEGDSGGE